jgi:hypothetical protein
LKRNTNPSVHGWKIGGMPAMGGAGMPDMGDDDPASGLTIEEIDKTRVKSETTATICDGDCSCIESDQT